MTKSLLSPGTTEMQLWLGRSLQHLSCFLPLPLALLYSFFLYCCHSWFDFTPTKALCYKETQKSSAPMPPIPTSILLVTQDSTDSPEAAAARCRELISSSSISSQWMSLCVKHSRGQHCTMNNIYSLKTSLENKQTTTHIRKDSARNYRSR